MTPTLIVRFIMATVFVAVLTKIGHDSYPNGLELCRTGIQSQSSLKLDMTPTQDTTSLIQSACRSPH